MIWVFLLFMCLLLDKLRCHLVNTPWCLETMHHSNRDSHCLISKNAGPKVGLFQTPLFLLTVRPSIRPAVPLSSAHAGRCLACTGSVSGQACLTRAEGRRGANCSVWFIPGWDQAGTQADDGTPRAAALPNIYLTLRWRAWHWCHWRWVCGESFRCLVLCVAAGLGPCLEGNRLRVGSVRHMGSRLEQLEGRVWLVSWQFGHAGGIVARWCNQPIFQRVESILFRKIFVFFLLGSY